MSWIDANTKLSNFTLESPRTKKLISPIFKIDAFNKTLILVNGLRIEFKNLLGLERI